MMPENEKELRQFQKRIKELAAKAYNHNIYTFTGFLSLAEQETVCRMAQELKALPWELCGGREDAERRMIRFGSPEAFGYTEDFPIVCLQISPVGEKFAEALTHRDFLGAVMNLGIDRSATGDICTVDKSAYLFCTEKMAPFLLENLTQVKHTRVKGALVQAAELPVKEPERISFTVSSERVDAMISRAFALSRNRSLDLFREKKIYVNGRLNENNSSLLKEGDTVSVRGYGKFVCYGTVRETKKGRLQVSIGIYR